MGHRIYNFAAGPAMLPEPVLEQLQAELRDCRGSGMSAMELPHRGALFKQIAVEAESDLRALLAVPDDYAVLFLHGGASSHFAAIPMNLAAGRSVAYVNGGYWSTKAIAAARAYAHVDIAADAAASDYRDIVPAAEWNVPADAVYVHYTANETIGGVEQPDTPAVEDVPLVSDMTSTLLSRPLEVGRYGLIYAGAQKNIGPAGLTVVIVRRDLLGEPMPATPPTFDYRRQDEAHSILNTPPTWAWYVAGLVFKWIAAEGGLAAMEAAARRKSALLYGAIDASDFYINRIAPRARSLTNVPFQLAEPALETEFLLAAADAGLKHLEGHRSVGGLRASFYNAMPEAGVAALVDFMRDFEQRHG
ncbi:MAG TPA: 3-phosphoserine/phosphohydroxythreonine transaminase [Gammaproteobacteria bacterium]|nr:3-phosphoserine/phosphohydroxythreonine transaminase [Gammaproteobacteria bacterium]